MDLSVLESTSRALEKSLDFWGWLLLLSTFFVVFGLILEYWNELEEISTLIRWPMAQFPLEKFRGLLGGIIVTVGVGGELIFTYMASRVETKLRENSHQIEATLTKEAGDAKQSADGALAVLKEANRQLGELETKAGALDMRLDSASSKLGGIEHVVRLQGPRWKLLDAGSTEFIQKLKPLPAKKFLL